MNALDFIKTAVRDYRVGAVIASSRFIAEQIAHEIKPDYEYIVEYGAGDGAITKEILARLPKRGKLIAVEINKNFLYELKNIEDGRLIIHGGDVRLLAQQLTHLGLPRIDAVVSGIPFSFLNSKERQEIVKRTHRALAPGGMFLVYQFSPFLVPLLKKYFSRVELRFAPLNFPPYFVMKAKK